MNENSLGGITGYAPAEGKPYNLYPQFPADIEEYMNNDLYNNVSEQWMNDFVESYFTENKYSHLSESYLEKVVLEEEYMSAIEIMDEILLEDDDERSVTDRAIDHEVQKSADRKQVQSDKNKEFKDKAKEAITKADKNKIAEVMAMAKANNKENMKKPGYYTKTRKLLRVAIQAGLQFGWFFMPFPIVVKLIGHLVLFTTFKAKENQITQDQTNYFKDQMKYYKELEEKTDDPVKRRNIVKVRREFEKANSTIMDNIRQKEGNKKKDDEE